MASVICAGLVAVDMVFEVADFPTRGTKHRADAARTIAGGGAQNAAAAVAAMEGGAILAGRIGDDELGEYIRAHLARIGVGDRYLATHPQAPTPRSAILITPDGDRTIVNHRDQRLYAGGIGGLDPFPAEAALADTRWPDGATDLMRAATAAGKPAVLDAEAPVRHAEGALWAATHVAFSEQGLADFAGGVDAAALTRAAERLECWVCVTRGAAPVLCHDGRDLTEVPTLPVTATDTLGSGDVWHGVFALSLAEGLTETGAVLRANAAAALKAAGRPVTAETGFVTKVAAALERFQGA